MNLVTDRQTSWNLTGHPSVFHDPSNLPYEAVRRMWWTGFGTGAILGLIAALSLFIAALVFDCRIVINAPTSGATDDVPGGPRDPGTAVRPVPLDAYDPTTDSPSPGIPGTEPQSPPQTVAPSADSTLPEGVSVPDRLPDINPLFPESFPDSPEDDASRPGPFSPSEPVRNTPPPIPLIHHGDRAVETRDLLAAMRAEERIERVAPIRRITMRGRCCGLRG